MINFYGVKLFYNNQYVVNERVTVKISYMTALLFIDGTHVESYYPKNLQPEYFVEDIIDRCNDYCIHLSLSEGYVVADYMIQHIC